MGGNWQAAPKSALGKVLHYLEEQRPYLMDYLQDGRLELSNNRTERSIKLFVIGRRISCLPTPLAVPGPVR